MARHRLVFAAKGLAATILSSYVCAAAFVLAMIISVPPFDSAYHEPLVLLDPFVWTVAAPVATLIGLILFPIALFSLWHRNATRCGLLTLGVTLLAIFIATPVLFLFAVPVAALVAVTSLLFCRYVPIPALRPHDTSSTPR